MSRQEIPFSLSGQAGRVAVDDQAVMVAFETGQWFSVRVRDGKAEITVCRDGYTPDEQPAVTIELNQVQP